MTPILFQWTDEGVMQPLGRFMNACDKEFVVGETYRLEAVEERSANSHRHYFASINEAWRNLPHHLAEQFPSAEHLRKRALIDAGFYDQEVIDCGTADVAERVAGYVGRHDEYAVATVNDAVVVVRRAKSQSTKAMPKDEFQKSKQAVLEIIAAMLSISPAEFAENAGRAA